MNEAFSDWLLSGDKGLCRCVEGNTTFLFLRVEKDADFDYLYSQRHFGRASLQRKERFDYAGMYCKRDGKLYDEQYDLKSVTQASDEWGVGALTDRLTTAVRRKVEAVIGNDKANLNVTELTTPYIREKWENIRRYYAKERARTLFLDVNESEPPTYQCAYMAENWTEESLLEYILDPDGYADREAEAYMAENQEEMLLEFMASEAVAAEFRALLADTTAPVHYVRRIMAAMNACSAKMVNVTIRKDGREFTFKTEAAEFRRDCQSSYNDWNIMAADRRAFHELFGRRAEYFPAEIVRITYARSVVYERSDDPEGGIAHD